LREQVWGVAEWVRAEAAGRIPERENECIISTDLAEVSDLSVGLILALTPHLTHENRTRMPYTVR
jgi:hypothetical protein